MTDHHWLIISVWVLDFYLTISFENKHMHNAQIQPFRQRDRDLPVQRERHVRRQCKTLWYDTVDGRKPKQPPGIYKTLRTMG